MDESTRSEWTLAAQTVWPSIALDPVAYATFLEAREGVARRAYAADLYLACACLQGSDGALEAFDAVLCAAVRGPALRVQATPVFVDDVTQAVREKLLLARPDHPPGLAQYEGRAALRSWVSMVASNAALNLRRGARERPHEAIDSGLPTLAGSAGAETELAKEQHRRAFHEALRAALALVPARDRELLVLHLVEGVTLEGLAARTGKDRSTMARWLASARRALFEHTKREMCKRLQIEETEYASVAAFVRSRLGQSVVEILKR